MLGEGWVEGLAISSRSSGNWARIHPPPLKSLSGKIKDRTQREIGGNRAYWVGSFQESCARRNIILCLRLR